MNKRLQTILETAENLMEILVQFDSEGRKLDSRPAPPFRPRPLLPSSRPPPSFVRGGRIPPPSNAPSGLLGAGDSVAGYDSTKEPGGLLGAGDSVAGYGRPGTGIEPRRPGIGINKPFNPIKPIYPPEFPRRPGIEMNKPFNPIEPIYPPEFPRRPNEPKRPGDPVGYLVYPTWPPKYRPIYPKAPPGNGDYDSRYGKPSPSSPPSTITPRYGGGMKPIPIPGLPKGPQKPRLPR